MSEQAEYIEDMPAVLAVEDHDATGLLPVVPSSVPFHLHEKVAFKEDHAKHPGMYGLIRAIGYEDGYVKFDVLVFDPFHGVRPDEDTTIERITFKEIQ